MIRIASTGIVILLLLAACLPVHAGEKPEISLKPYRFEPAKGEAVEAEWGEFEVPENRDNPGSRKIRLAFVRFKSTNPQPGHPIVYLAGGPGGSGIQTAKGRRFPLFMALREVADVIAFDQRGTGASNHIPPYRGDAPLPLDEPVGIDTAMPYMREHATSALAFWEEAGVDIAGYTTRQSAADLEDLRLAIGAEKLNL